MNDMIIEGKYLAKSFFKNKIYDMDGQAFEDYFVKIMRYHDSSFYPVKAYGNIGDRKNDGFNKDTGEYYQVYAPEVLSKRTREAVNKLNEDFKELYIYWDDKLEIKKFYYVLNNKYKAIEPKIHEAILYLEQEYSTISFNLLLTDQLEEIFINLPDDQIHDLVGYIPNPSKIEIFDAKVMNDVIHYLLSISFKYINDKIPDNPDFEDKISFNNLGIHTATLLRIGSYQKKELDEYFHRQSELKEILRNKFTEFYKLGIELFTNNSDDVFSYILNKSCNQTTKQVVDCVLVLMAYYFEYCDIFEEPQKGLF